MHRHKFVFQFINIRKHHRRRYTDSIRDTEKAALVRQCDTSKKITLRESLCCTEIVFFEDVHVKFIELKKIFFQRFYIRRNNLFDSVNMVRHSVMYI